MAGTAVRSFLDSILERGLESSVLKGGDLIVIVGKGLRSYDDPVLLPTLKKIFEEEYGIQAQVDPLNEGRLIVDAENLRVFVAGRSWR